MKAVSLESMVLRKNLALLWSLLIIFLLIEDPRLDYPVSSQPLKTQSFQVPNTRVPKWLYLTSPTRIPRWGRNPSPRPDTTGTKAITIRFFTSYVTSAAL